MRTVFVLFALLFAVSAHAQAGNPPPGTLYDNLRHILTVDGDTGTVHLCPTRRLFVTGNGLSASVLLTGPCRALTPLPEPPICDPDSPQVGPCLQPDPPPPPEPVDCDGPMIGPAPPPPECL